MHWLTYYPAVRLAFPFICGIIVSKSLCEIPLLVMLAVALTLWLLLCISLRIRSSVPCSLCIISLAFVLGMTDYGQYDKSVRIDWGRERSIYAGILQDCPVVRNRSFLLKIRLADRNGKVNGSEVYLYVPKTDSVLSLRPGDVLCFNGRINGTGDSGDDSGYDSYLYGKGVSGTLWVNSSDWHKLTSFRSGRLRYRLAAFRGKMSVMYAEWGLRDKALAVVRSVILADKSLLNDDTRDTFSASGASHLLAVSGLHVGIIYACLSLLIPSMMSSYGRVLRESVIISAMWAYAVMIGLPLSITRSLIMFSVAFVCRSLRRDNSPLNSLAVSAVMILFIDPNGLYDVGFQLSFLAVFFILFLQPSLSQLLRPENPVVAYLWNLVTVSVSAQIGTAPLVAYVFNALPSYFLITNIVAIPVMFAIVACAMLMCMAAVVPIAGRLLAAVITFSVDFLDEAMRWIVDTPGSVMDTYIDSVTDVWLIYVMLTAVSVWIIYRKSKTLIWIACTADVWMALSLFDIC